MHALRVPNWIVQPFNLSFEPDDFHVMAFIADHPEFEAVEAMIRYRVGRTPLVRAIITRHDQSQLDHSNDDTLPSVLTGARKTCFREIACVMENLGAAKRIAVRFESFGNELVELDVTSLGLPDAARGGLSDPGGHSLGSSLPIMHRGRSALAAPSSRVTIGGRAHLIPSRIEVQGRVVALEGFLTEEHHMAALRSAATELQLIEMPTAFREGERWVYSSADGLATYGLSRVSETGDIEISRSDTKEEWIRGKVIAGSIELVELRIRKPSDPRHFASLTFSDGNFSIGIDGNDGLVAGTFEAAQTDDEHASIVLMPSSPSWAVARPVTVTMARERLADISVHTSVGAPSPSN